ncbi:MAG: hypothetical protein U1A78_40435 [Polyangia bacterium]
MVCSMGGSPQPAQSATTAHPARAASRPRQERSDGLKDEDEARDEAREEVKGEDRDEDGVGIGIAVAVVAMGKPPG